MQVHTDHVVGRPMFRPQPTPVSRAYPRLAHTQRPEPEGLSAAELRRIVAEVLG